MSEPTYTKAEIEKALFQGYKDWCAARGHHELMCDPVTDELPFIMAALQETEKEPDHFKGSDNRHETERYEPY